jgi:septum formation protein
MQCNTLFLGSKSPSRQLLLKMSQIPFILVSQDADEQVCPLELSLANLVREIALQKMAHVIMPPHSQVKNLVAYVLTADTLVQNADGDVYGKPADYQKAIVMIKNARRGMKLSTAFCIEKRRWNAELSAWDCLNRVIDVVSSEYVIDLSDEYIDWYLKNSIGLQCAGGFAVEDVGMQFIKTVNGSFSNIMGLPLYEVRSALKELHFFD